MLADRPQKPENVPRQKAHVYITLIICTAIFIYFYSYSESWKNTNFLVQERSNSLSTINNSVNDKQVIHQETTAPDAIVTRNKVPSKLLEILLLSTKSTLQKVTSEDTGSSHGNAGLITMSTVSNSGSSANEINEVKNQNSPSTNATTWTVSKTTADVTTPNAIHVTTNPTTDSTVASISKNIANVNSITVLDNLVEDNFSTVKGFLVYSNHCRIPDLDPMHPSVRDLVEITPPINCSKDEILTKTNGNILILDTNAARRRTSGNNYTCCYRSLFRENDGESDNDVGLGEECIQFIKEITIQDEFIVVECKHQNGTIFYKEFHSFIQDKPDVEKRCKQHDSSNYSLLIIGIDAMSRMNMHRQLNSTARYFLGDMEGIEMYGFNKVGDNTFPNLIPLLMGYDERELPEVCWNSSAEPLDKCNFMWKRFEERGYRTFYAEDAPHISSFNYLKRGFYHQPTDYYFRPFIKAYQEELGKEKHLNCYWCVGSISETEAVLHWTQQFASHFHNRSYFAFSWINSLTHDYLNVGSSGDHLYENFFRILHQSGALNRTIVMVMGDHGMRWGEIRKTYIGRLEERLPMLLIYLPPSFKREYPKAAKALKLNSHRLITPFDLHATLLNVLHPHNWTLVNTDNVSDELALNFRRRALSLFDPVPNSRSCDEAFIEEHWCTCEESLPVDTDNKAVEKAAAFLVSYINGLLTLESKKCASLRLNSTADARLWQPAFEHQGHTAEDNIYTVVIQTKPGGGIFEGTVKISDPQQNYELLGTISRLNLYGNQSSCVDDAHLRKYCYCL